MAAVTGCTWTMVRGCLRCIDGVSRNIPREDCRVSGKGHATPEGLLAALPPGPVGPPVISAAPGPGLYAMPEGGWVYGLPGDYPGAPAAFGGFGGGPVWVHDAHTGEWLEHDATPPSPLPAALTPLPAVPVLEVPVPAPEGVPTIGMPAPRPPVVPVHVPEPAALGLFLVALAALAIVRRRA